MYNKYLKERVNEKRVNKYLHPFKWGLKMRGLTLPYRPFCKENSIRTCPYVYMNIYTHIVYIYIIVTWNIYI